MSHPSQDNLDYWSTAREPWPSLLFILPFLIIYEVGAIAHAHVPTSRNGADLWIRHVGIEHGVPVEWLFPILAPLLLLGWQFVARRPWKWSYETLAGMFAESLMFAMFLVLIGQATAYAFPILGLPPLALNNLPRAVTFLGAGIYEEMLFRLTLLPCCFLVLRMLFVPAILSMLASILISSWLFATAHYISSTALFSPLELSQATTMVLNQPELWFSYTFRFLAGILFSVLFWVRGFGIAVGCHILYDLFVGVVLAEVG